MCLLIQLPDNHLLSFTKSEQHLKDPLKLHLSNTPLALLGAYKSRIVQCNDNANNDQTAFDVYSEPSKSSEVHHYFKICII